MVAGTWKRGHHRRGRAVGVLGTAPAVPQTPRSLSTSAAPGGDGAPSPGTNDPPPWWEVTEVTPEGLGGVEGLAGSLPADPDPSWLVTVGDHLPPASIPVTKEVEKDIKAWLAVASLIPADILAVADPYCAGAYAQALPQIIDAAVPIICRSQAVLQFMLGNKGFVEWIRLAAAFKPVIVAVWAHHVVKSVDITGEAVGDDFSQYRAVA